jgi:hypothetical protein
MNRAAQIYSELLARHEARVIAADAPREAMRNRLLRRADWRFLLPDPRPRRIICFADGLLARAVALIADQVVEPTANPSGDCDLAAAVNPDPSTLRKAWAALRPGGMFYGEWYSPSISGPPGVRQQLEASGFTDVACYWPWPWPDRESPLFWLPMEAPGALHYFLATRPTTRSIRRRLWSAVLQGLWRFGLRARLMIPMCAVAHKPADNRASAGREGANENLLDSIRAGWSDWGLGPPPRRLSRLLLTGGHSSLNKVVGLIFADSDRYPRMIVKQPRVPESVPALAREATALRAIQALRPEGMRGVPQVLFFRESANQTALGETVATGQPLLTQVRPDNYRDLALKVTGWLADLAGHAPPCPCAEWWDRLIETPLAEFEQSFGPILDPGQLRETKAILATLGDLPLVCEQRDCSPWNVLVAADGELAVLDWESAELRGLPALDLIYFLTYLSFFLNGAMESGRFREAYRATLDSATFTGRVQAECEQRYCERTGLELAVLRPLRLLTWLIHSCLEYKRFVAEAVNQPESAALRRSLFVSLWEEELRSAPKKSR